MIRPEFNGFSGARLEIVSTATSSRVRKTASSPSASKRLRLQMEKQLQFASLASSLRTPSILESGEIDGCFYFEMEYVAGLDGHRFLERCGLSELRNFADQLVIFLEEAASFQAIASCDSSDLFSACVDKLLEVHRKDVGLTDEMVGRLLLSLGQVKEMDLRNPGFCHGDFTLENIMVDSFGRLWLVDFLDSAFEHPIQDYVKLSQDVLGSWFEVKGRRISPAVLCYLSDRLTEKISSLSPLYASVEPSLLALNFCRILPYASSSSERDFILKRIHRFCHSRP